MIQSILSLGLNELYAKLQARKISCEELCLFYLERIGKIGMRNALNCVAAVNPEALKENIADVDAPFVKTLREKGAVILGKTNMTEFANFLTQGLPGGYSSLGGQVVNAYDRTNSPSGSSSGSAVAMSARLCSFAVGTDTSFSVVGCATENDKTRNHPLRRSLSVWTYNRELVSEEQMGRYGMLFDRLKTDGWVFTEQPGRNTDKLAELMLRRFSTELREYLEKHKGSAVGKLTPENVLAKYREDPEKLAPYGTDYLEKSLEYERDSENTRAVLEIRAEMAREHELLTEELSGFDACIMAGVTCIMHFAGLPSLSLPFTVASENGLPRSVILFGTDMRTLLAVGEEIERHSDMISMPKLEEYAPLEG